MQDGFHFGEDIVVDEANDAAFVVVSTIVKIGVHPTHEGFAIVVLSF
jgi:hypothetical protein